MSKDSAWKRLERRHAKRFPGGLRHWRPDYSDVAPDGESGTETWDCKAYQRHAAITLFVRAEEKYREWTNGRRFHLCLFATSRKGAGDFVLVRASDYAELVRCEALFNAREEIDGP